MTAIADSVFDSGLSTIVSNGTSLHILDADVGLTWSSIAAAELAEETVTCTGPGNADNTNGRSVKIPAINNGTIVTGGTAGYWALSNGTDTIYASGQLTTPQVVTATNSFTLPEIEIAIRDATVAA